MSRIRKYIRIIGWLALVGASLSQLGCGAMQQARAVSYQPPNLPVAISSALDRARLVMVGEQHDLNGHHRLQLAVLRQMHQSNPRLIVAVEWLQAPYQSVADDFIAGRIGEAEFLRGVQYFRRWGFDYRMLRPIFDYARTHGLRIVALNTPREITRKISTHGLDALTPKERERWLPAGTQADAAYRKRLRDVLASHGERQPDFDNFLAAQLAWDSTMSRGVSRLLNKHPRHRVLVFAGLGHVAFPGTIPDRVAQQVSVQSLVISPTLGHEAKLKADILVDVPQESLPAKARLGVFLDTKSKRLRITKFSKTSHLDDAGVREGDVLVGLNGTPTPDFTSLQLVLAGLASGVEAELELENPQGQRRNLRARLL